MYKVTAEMSFIGRTESTEYFRNCLVEAMGSVLLNYDRHGLPKEKADSQMTQIWTAFESAGDYDRDDMHEYINRFDVKPETAKWLTEGFVDYY